MITYTRQDSREIAKFVSKHSLGEMSAEKIESLRAKTIKREKRFFIGFIFVLLCLMGGLIYEGCEIAPTIFVTIVLIVGYVAYHSTLFPESLVPIAGTKHCLEAAKLVTEGLPEVLAWRDAAVAARGQLYIFDSLYMYSIKNEFEAKAVIEKSQQEHAEACRIAHGIKDLA